MLGTGTGLIQSQRRSPSVLIETDTTSIIVDCGWGVPEAINSLQFGLHTLGHLCITHSHADHMAALPALLQSQLIANIEHLPGEARSTPLTIHGYPAISKDIATLAKMMVPELNLARDLRIVEHTHGKVRTYGQLGITGISVKHVPTLQAVSFAFEQAGKKVVVTGDLGWDEAVLPLLQDADIAIIDASASQEEFEAEPHRSHLAPIQCGQLASLANVKHLVLTSLYDREPAADITAAVRKYYTGRLTIPHDQQTFVI